MSLKNLKLPEEVVPIPGGESITVRGLSLADITAIVRKHGAAVRALFAKYAGQYADQAASIEDQTLNEIGASLLETAPDLAAAVIAYGAGEPDPEAVKTAARLPFPVQIDAIEKIGKLTFDAEGGPKKVLETVIRVLQGTTNIMAELRTSTIGSLESGHK